MLYELEQFLEQNNYDLDNLAFYLKILDFKQEKTNRNIVLTPSIAITSSLLTCVISPFKVFHPLEILEILRIEEISNYTCHLDFGLLHQHVLPQLDQQDYHAHSKTHLDQHR